ncbi:YbaB/EbfC family nucleoid-associated protein [Naumannella huperziae]
MSITMKRATTGTVGAYLTSGDVQKVRQVRDRTGNVTVSGRSGAKVLVTLAKNGDLVGVDFDPAGYLNPDPDEALFPTDWIGRQRELGLSVIRSEGAFAARNDSVALRAAFISSLPNDVVRVVSVSSFWLQRKHNGTLVAAVRNCDNPLGLVLADQFDPLEGAEAVASLQAVLEAAAPAERRVELLRTDVHAIAFAAAGGAHAAIGLTTTGRHHPQPMSRPAREKFDQRQQSPAVWIPELLSWQRGIRLTALEPFDGAGITRCGCDHCDDRDLMRFNYEWPQVPADVRADAQGHDVASWVALRNRVLNAADPQAAWRAACDAALATEMRLADNYKVALSMPRSLAAWR